MEDPALITDPDAALEPFLQAARDTTAANLSTIRALVLKVLADTDVFCGYDQIKAAIMQQLKEKVDDEESKKLFNTLDLFSYGVYSDYASNPSNYMALHAAQVFKLRQLTVLSMVQAACLKKVGSITYQDLQQALDVPDRAAVEDVLTACLYQHAVSGQLCQRSQSFIILAYSHHHTGHHHHQVCQSRDVSMEDVGQMLQMVRNWQEGPLIQANLQLEQQAKRVAKHLESDSAWAKAARERQKKNQETASSMLGVRNESGAFEAISLTDSMPGSRRQKRSRGGLMSGLADFGSEMRGPFHQFLS